MKISRIPAVLLSGGLLLASVVAAQADPVQADPVQADPVQADPVQADRVQADRVQSGETPKESPGDLAREGLEQMMQALRLLVESIPQYELPEVLENGDIIIRRKHPEPKDEAPEMDETAT